MERIFVKPSIKGSIIRDPKSKMPLPEEGKSVPNLTYWRRRLKDGDVTIVKKTKVKENSTKTKSEK